ncbi:MAG: DUF58 domain-containing protein [Thermoplasmata archaeon]
MKNIKLSKYGFSLILAFSVFISLGAMLRIPQAIFFTLPLILFYIIGILFFKDGEIKINRNFLNNIAFVNEELEYEIEIISKGFEGNVTIENGDIRHKVYIKNNETIKVNGKIKFNKFGKYNYSKIDLTLTDPLYIFKFSNSIIDEAVIRVFPEAENLKKFKLKSKKTRVIVGDIPSKFLGKGDDFYSIREFIYGDDKKDINWKRTAFANRLMVNQFLSEKAGNTVILLDVRRYEKSDEDYETNLKGSIKAALTLSNVILSSRNRLGLIILKNTVDWIYPGYGKKQYLKIMESLLNVESESISYIPLEYGKRIITKFFPPNSKVIIITSLFDNKINEIVYDLILKRYDLLVLVPYFESAIHDTVKEIISFERRTKIRIISKYAKVIEWNINSPLTKSLEVAK